MPSTGLCEPAEAGEAPALALMRPGRLPTTSTSIPARWGSLGATGTPSLRDSGRTAAISSQAWVFLGSIFSNL